MTYSTNNWPSGSNSNLSSKRGRGREGESLSSERERGGESCVQTTCANIECVN